MNLTYLGKFVKSRYYWPTVAVASLGIGVAVGIAADRISSREKAIDDFTEDDKIDDDGDTMLLPFPEGVNKPVNEKPEMDKVVNDEIFVKPDISRLRDYTKYSSMARKYANGQTEGSEHVEEEHASRGSTVVENVMEDDRFELISEEEFVKEVGNENGYVSATGTYFVQDGVLAGWNDHLEEKDILNTVGLSAISKFDDPETRAVYVRNSQLKVLYEIVRCDDTMESVMLEEKAQEIDAVQEDAG